jgi:hypothetical protein
MYMFHIMAMYGSSASEYATFLVLASTHEEARELFGVKYPKYNVCSSYRINDYISLSNPVIKITG